MSLDCEIKEVINQDFLHGAQRAVGVWALEKDFKNVLGHKRLFLFFFSLSWKVKKSQHAIQSCHLCPSSLISFNRSNQIIA